MFNAIIVRTEVFNNLLTTVFSFEFPFLNVISYKRLLYNCGQLQILFRNVYANLFSVDIFEINKNKLVTKKK